MVSGKRLSFSHLMYFMIPKCLYFIKKTNTYGFLLSVVTFFITVSYTNMNYDGHLGFIGPQLIMNAETLPCIYTMHMAKKHTYVININL
jgi:hypothetical protein